ncbi:MAG: nucleotidyltransferase family protein [Hungatella sp.]
MRYRNFEATYMISLLSATLNQRIPQTSTGTLDWRELFYLAEYHDVTNLAFYTIMGLPDSVPQIWKDRFSKIFRKWVTINTVQEKEVRLFTDAMEEEKISFLVMKDWMMKRYYLQADMRAVDCIAFLIKPKDEEATKELMYELGYRCEGIDSYGTMHYDKVNGCRITIYQKLFVENAKIYAYFAKIWRRAQPIGGYSSRHALGIDDFYIYLIADTCEAYACGEVDIRYIMDIHLYLKKHKATLNRVYIDTELGGLELLKLARYLEEVGDLWFGVYEGVEPRICKDVEEYILTKGCYGRETSIMLCPMIQDREIWKIRAARRERIYHCLRWCFPPAAQMKVQFSVLNKISWLLPLFWMVRLLQLFYLKVKLKLTGVSRRITLKTHALSCKLKAKDLSDAEKPSVEDAPLPMPETRAAQQSEPVNTEAELLKSSMEEEQIFEIPGVEFELPEDEDEEEYEAIGSEHMEEGEKEDTYQ